MEYSTTKSDGYCTPQNVSYHMSQKLKMQRRSTYFIVLKCVADFIIIAVLIHGMGDVRVVSAKRYRLSDVEIGRVILLSKSASHILSHYSTLKLVGLVGRLMYNSSLRFCLRPTSCLSFTVVRGQPMVSQRRANSEHHILNSGAVKNGMLAMSLAPTPG